MIKNTVNVVGYNDSTIIKKHTFTLGDGFNFSNGRIIIFEDYNKATYAHDGFIGATTRTIYLGVDEKGHGKLRDSSSSIGLVPNFLFFPLLGGGTTDIRFEKVK